MKRIFLLAFLLLHFIPSRSQQLSYALYEILHKEDLKASPVDFDNQYGGIIGSAFLADQWTSGRAFTMMKAYPLKKIKFDIYKNKVYINNNDTIYDISSAGIIQFDIFPDDDTAKKMSFNNGFNIEEITPDKFVQVLTEGKIAFIKYLKVEIEEVYESSPTYKEKKFLERNKYYVVDESQAGKEITITKKNLEKILAAKWDKVNAYAKSSGASLNNEEGWKKLISYYNSL